MKKENTEKKEKKCLSTKESLSRIGKGLISNQACLESGRMPFYWAILIFVISVVITWVPFLKNGYTTDNSKILDSSNNAEVDKGLKSFLTADYTKKFVINSNNKTLDMVPGFEGLSTETISSENLTKKLNGEITTLLKGTYNDNGSKTDSYVSTPTYLNFDYYFDSFTTKKSDQIDNTITSTTTSSSTTTYDYDKSGLNVYLMTYYFPTLSTKEEKALSYFQNFVYNEVFNLNASGKMQNYPHSFMFLSQDTIAIYIFNLNSYKNMNYTSTFSGKLNDAFASITSDTNFISFLNKGNDSISINDLYTNFRYTLNDSAKATAIHTVWMNILMLSCIDLGTVLVASIILLIMHKRKSSIMRDVNFFNTLIEATTFFLTPAILAMAVGFFNTSWSYMLIIGGVLIRIVWSSSKLMPPVGAEQDKPLYQARS